MPKLYLREHSVSNKGAHPLTISGKRTKAYSVWYSMLDRCYLNNPKAPTYSDCEVCQEWFYFQNFAKWFHENYKEGFQLDKDLLKPNNKIYSPETCVFVPKELNCLLTDHGRARGKYPQWVSRVKTPTETYQSALSKKNKIQYLGSFKSIEMAFSVYKEAKEAYVKEVAKEYFEQGDIDLITHKALLKWEL